mmetsp:Transcript_9151/g.13732  ORF Transcript_9151/g.13732 Transcript_9151/m.13732 type:complete len:332 (-) Transcript_9151:223-1218(-)|eukprot:CAMPEP_0167746328 /NCGR_PEP_ID=MMETSP0110_2-20121227/3652_1 /TAXON_ID=629695 /ORGANISM="Gymnochlora sp., Strain CCMP2014" /LENGTH=331 /DNA_ID=CAMNT_0007631081 /DNA_START=34 /DNA_END=1029 /DNA_ORIENTATION=+
MTEKINWPAEWKDSAGEITIAARSRVKSSIKLYSSWFCPFAQRAWIAMEEKKVSYQWVEINPYEVDPKELGGYTKKALPLSEKGKRHPGFLEVSPTGLIPGLDNSGEKVHDSLIVVQYIDEIFKGESFLPESAIEKARQRYWSTFVTEKIQKNYYTMLIAQDKKIQESSREAFFDTCRQFVKEMKSDGPFFLGKKFTMVDIAFAPFYQRMLWVGGHYRDLTFPEDNDFKRLNTWWEAVSTRPSVASTLVCKPRLLSSYKQYARNEATSNYGLMIQDRIRQQKSKSKDIAATSVKASKAMMFSGKTVVGLCTVVGVASFFAAKTLGVRSARH